MEIKEEKPDLCDICHKPKQEHSAALTIMKTDEGSAPNICKLVSVKQEDSSAENLEYVYIRETDKKLYWYNPYHTAFKDSKSSTSHTTENTHDKYCIETPMVLTEISNKLHMYNSCQEPCSNRDSFLCHKEHHPFPSVLELAMHETDTNPDLCAVQCKHLGNILFDCALCKKVVKKEEDLNCHVVVHNGISTGKEAKTETVKTEEDGGKTFSKRAREVDCEKSSTCSSEQLIDGHMLTPTNSTQSAEKRYHCKYCGKVFTQSGKLSGHLRTHSGGKLYECDQCDKPSEGKVI